MSEFPVIDMQDPSAPAAIAKAFKDFGVFYLENHGVPEDVFERTFQASKAFFSLGVDDKMSVKVGEKGRGYTAMYEETLDLDIQTKGGTKELYDIYREIAADSEVATKHLRGPNQWPSEDLVPGWKETMLDYYSRLEALSFKLFGMLSAGLGIDPAFFEACHSEPMSALRLNHYSSEVSDLDKGVQGCGAHTDYGALSIVTADDAGLEVWHNEEWCDAPPRPGMLFCHVADMLETWTNGQLKAPKHRVMNRLGRERYSLLFFNQANYDVVLECLPEFCSEENPARYQTRTSGQHLTGLYTKRIDDFESNRVTKKDQTT